MLDRLGLRGLCFAAVLVGGPASGADRNVPKPFLLKQGEAIAVSGPSGTEQLVEPRDLEALPTVKVTVDVEPGHTPSQRSYEGPLLWAVLGRAGAVDGLKFHEQVHQAVIVTGSDGYSVVLSLGEISPEFESKPVIVAVRQDGQPLEPGHFRLVVPGEARAGRSARDLTRISVIVPRAN